MLCVRPTQINLHDSWNSNESLPRDWSKQCMFTMVRLNGRYCSSPRSIQRAVRSTTVSNMSSQKVYINKKIECQSNQMVLWKRTSHHHRSSQSRLLWCYKVFSAYLKGFLQSDISESDFLQSDILEITFSENSLLPGKFPVPNKIFMSRCKEQLFQTIFQAPRSIGLHEPMHRSAVPSESSLWTAQCISQSNFESNFPFKHRENRFCTIFTFG